MTIKSIDTYFTGQEGVYPRLIRMITDDTLITLLTPGYLVNSYYQGCQNILPTDFIFSSFINNAGELTQNLFVPKFNQGIITLESMATNQFLTPTLNMTGVGNTPIDGTVALTNGSVVVTGTGTTFTALYPGQAIVFLGTPYEILNVKSETVLLLTNNYGGATMAGLKAYVDDTFLNFYTRAQKLINTIGPAGQLLASELRGANQPVRRFDPTISGGAVSPADGNAILTPINTTPGTITLPKVADSQLAEGFQFDVAQLGQGSTSIVADAADIVVYPTGFSTITQDSVAHVKLINRNLITGNISGTWSIEVPPQLQTYSNIALDCAGPWASNQTINIRVERYGNLVSMWVGGRLAPINGATNATPITPLTTLDAIFRPTDITNFVITVEAGTARLQSAGLLAVNADGTLVIYPSLDPVYFPNWDGTDGVTRVGVLPFNVSWLANS